MRLLKISVLPAWLLSILLFAGCFSPAKTARAPEGTILASRSDSKNQPAENLVQKKTVQRRSAVLPIEGRRTYYIERKGRKRISVPSLATLNQDLSKTQLWTFWPLAGTNLWVAANSLPYKSEGAAQPGDAGYYSLKVYLFDPNTITFRRQLKTVKNPYDGSMDLWFDSANRTLTYKTGDGEHGFETYNFLADTTVETGRPGTQPFRPKKELPTACM